MKRFFLIFGLLFSSFCFADLDEMMKIYNNPEYSPEIDGCRGAAYCNGFVALSKLWTQIPDDYLYLGEYDIKDLARINITFAEEDGRGIGIARGFYFYQEKTLNFRDAVGLKFVHNKYINHEAGLAILLYIEEQNNWIKD